MKRAERIWLLLFGVAMLVTFSASSAWAAGILCGDADGAAHPSNVPCGCGDIVVSNTVLTSEDKLTNCPPPFALRVLGGVVLGISSKVITCDGSFFTVGIQIAGNGVTIDGGSGTIKSCGFGIIGVTSNSTISGVYVRDNFETGIVLDFGSNNNTLAGNLCHSNGVDGISVRGNGNTLDRNYCRGNGSDGIDVSGSFNSLNKNQTRNNGGDGIHFAGNSNTLDRNLASGNEGTGIDVDGSFNHFTSNRSQNSGAHGIFAPDLTNTSTEDNITPGSGINPGCVIGGFVDNDRC